MSQEIEFFRKEYYEAVRLYLWYQGSKFSFFQGKTSKTEAERYRYLANYNFEQILKRNGQKE